MRPLSLTCFGVGDGWPSSDRNHSAFLYRFENAAFLLDCGEPVSRSYKASALPYDLIDRIFISHLHFDHVGGFFMLMQGFWLEGRKRPLPVYLPPDGIEPLRLTLNAGCIFTELLPFQLAFEPMRSERPVEWDGLRVTPFRTSHLDDLQRKFRSRHAQAFDAFCFLIEAPGWRIGHSADVGGVEDLLPLLQQPLDLLVCEISHVNPEELFALLKSRSIGRIVFVHLSREHRGRLKELRALAETMLSPAQVEFPEDGQEFTF